MCNAEVKTYDRNVLENYGVNKKWEINESNRHNVMNTHAVDASEKIYDFEDILSETDEYFLKQMSCSIHIYFFLYVICISSSYFYICYFLIRFEFHPLYFSYFLTKYKYLYLLIILTFRNNKLYNQIYLYN
jgi:hypothetical protein